MRKNIPAILIVLFTSTLYMTYFTTNVVLFQVVVYILILLCYFFAQKESLVQNPAKKLYIIYCVFTVIYLIRTFIDIEFLNVKQNLYSSDSTVFFFMLNGIVFPAIMLPRLKRADSYLHSFVVFSLFITYSLFVTYWNFIHGNISLTKDQRVMANESLGVIQYGHLGVTSIIMSIYFFAKRTGNKWLNLLSVMMFFIGVISIFLSGTRSAIVSVFAVSFIYILAHTRKKALIIVFFLFVMLYILSNEIQSFFDSYQINSVNRIFELFEENDYDKSSGRSLLWKKAFDDILDKPFFGVSSFFKYSDLTFVHNSIIEITYSLGVFGGCMFIYLNFQAIKICIKELKGNSIDNWCFVFLYIQYFVYSLFSESILRLSLYWVFLSIIIGINLQNHKQYVNNLSRNTNI